MRRNQMPNDASNPAERRRLARLLEAVLVVFFVEERPGGLPRRAEPVLRLVFAYWRVFFLVYAFWRCVLAVSVISLAL
jgi:hypothetical protein